MALLREISEYATKVAETGSKVAKKTTKVAALKYSNYAAREDIGKLYEKIGERYYQKHGLNPEPGFEELCDRVTELQTLINGNNAAINEIQIDGVLDEVVVEPED